MKDHNSLKIQENKMRNENTLRRDTKMEFIRNILEDSKIAMFTGYK